jgi:hypothetical protein
MDRSLAHDLRGAVAAATSNIEFVRSHPLAEGLGLALSETLNELRVVSDVIALLGSAGERVLEVDLRAAFMVHRGGGALGVDATEAPFVVRANSVQIGEVATRVCAISLRGRASTESEKCTVAPVDPDGARALLATDVLANAHLKGELHGSSLILKRND